MRAVTSEEKRWKAEGDADTLERSAEIQDDKRRLKAALDASRKRADVVAKVGERLKKLFGKGGADGMGK
jgi:hypothetical protein